MDDLAVRPGSHPEDRLERVGQPCNTARFNKVSLYLRAYPMVESTFLNFFAIFLRRAYFFPKGGRGYNDYTGYEGYRVNCRGVLENGLAAGVYKRALPATGSHNQRVPPGVR